MDKISVRKRRHALLKSVSKREREREKKKESFLLMQMCINCAFMSQMNLNVI